MSYHNIFAVRILFAGHVTGTISAIQLARIVPRNIETVKPSILVSIYSIKHKKNVKYQMLGNILSIVYLFDFFFLIQISKFCIVKAFILIKIRSQVIKNLAKLYKLFFDKTFKQQICYFTVPLILAQANKLISQEENCTVEL